MKQIIRWGSFLFLAGVACLVLSPVQAGDAKKESPSTPGLSLSEIAQKVRAADAGTPATPPAKVKKVKEKSAGPAVKKAKEKSKTKFIRLKRNGKKELTALQTAVVRYVPAKGKSDLVVDLVSVVHVGERGYYYRLNDRFEDYDVVLYELVAPKGVIPRPGRKSDNPIAILQKVMTLVLQLDLQTKCIDYTCTNFVHADLTPKEMAAKMKNRGDTPLTLALSIAADVLREQNLREMKLKQNPGKKQDLGDFDPFALLTDPQAPVKLKRMMAEQMEQVGEGAGLGHTLTTILVKDRNAACMKVFQQQLTAGKKKIAIFYGAAHMPDFERRLVEDFGMRRQNVEWMTAWDLRPQQINLLELLKRVGP